MAFFFIFTIISYTDEYKVRSKLKGSMCSLSNKEADRTLLHPNLNNPVLNTAPIRINQNFQQTSKKE